MQKKIANALLFNAYDNLLSERVHTIDVRDLNTLVGCDSRNFTHLKKTLKEMTKISIEWNILNDKGQTDWGVSSLLSSANIMDGTCHYEYSLGLAEKLYNPEVYSRINLAIQRCLGSNYSLALYENCFRYLGIGTTGWWSLGSIKKLLGVEEGTYYDDFRRFNSKIIKPAIKDINSNSNIFIDVEFGKERRKVTKVRFSVHENENYHNADDVHNILETQAYQLLIAYNIGKSVAREWIIQYGEEYVLEKVQYATQMQSAGKIRSSIGGFLMSAIEKDFKSNEDVQKESEKIRRSSVEKAKKKEALEEKKASLEKNIAHTHKTFCIEIIEKYFSNLSEGEQKKIKKDFMKEHIDSTFKEMDFRRSQWSARFTHPEIISFWQDNFGLKFPTLSEFKKKHPSIPKHLQDVA